MPLTDFSETPSIAALRAEALAKVNPQIASLAPGIGELAGSFAYGQVWSRSGLSNRDRSIATIAALVALNCPDELTVHVLRGLANGLTKEEVGEIITQLTPYVGFPLAVSAVAAVGDYVARVDPDEIGQAPT